VPDLFFLTTYSLLILFWAQLSHTATGAPFPWLRPAFLISNGLLYLGFLLIVVLGGSKMLGRGQVLQALFVLLGVSYILSTLFLFKYALRFRKMALPYVLRRRLIALCVLCGVVFIVHVAYYLGVATGLLSTWVAAAGYPPQIDAYIFDALLYPLWELLPSLAILAVLHKRKPGSGMAPHHLSSAYPYLDSVPYTKIGNGQLGSVGGGGGGGAGGGNGGASHSAALANAFYKLNGSGGGGGGGGGRGFGAGEKGGRQQQHPWMNVVVKEGRDAQGGGGVLGLMGIYTPIEATTTPSTSNESTASAYQVGKLVGGRGER